MRRCSNKTAIALAAVIGAFIGGLLPASSALAFSTASVATVSQPQQVLLAAGVASQPLGNVIVSFADNGSSHVWSTGDVITAQLWDGTSNAALSNTAANAFENAGLAVTPHLVATNVDASYYGLALAKSVTSNVDDEFVITFTKDAPEDSNTTKFTVSGLEVTLGSLIPAGHQIQLKLTASNGHPFVGASATASVPVATIPTMSVAGSAVVTGAPSAAGLPVGTLTLRDSTGAVVTAGDQIDLTLTGGFFSTAGTMSGTLSATTTATITTTTNLNDTLTLTGAKTSTVGDILRLAGARITLPAAAGEVFLIAKDVTRSSVLGAVGVATVVTQTRIGGTDRYSTASKLFDTDFSAASTVVLTSGTNYPDALSASYLAGQLGTGVLTTDPNTLPAATRGELLTRGIATVYIIGGTEAVSADVAEQVAGFHVSNNADEPLINVVRIAGADRYATNNLVDSYSRSAMTTAIVATGENFADALAVGPAVYQTGYPLILTPGATLSASAKATIKTLGITHAVIVGGTSAISTAVETELNAAGVSVDYRIAGAERTDTAAQVAAWETGGLAGHDIYPALGGLGFSGTNLVNIARGDSFADALAASSIAGFDENVIVLTSSPSALGAGIPEYFGGRAGTTTTVRALGETSAIFATTLDAAAEALTGRLTY
jgi:putative cell wall-binding protein